MVSYGGNAGTSHQKVADINPKFELKANGTISSIIEGISGGVGLNIKDKDNNTRMSLNNNTGIKIYSGLDLVAYSDSGSTQKALLDGATGDLTLSGDVTANSFTGSLSGNASTATEATNVTVSANDTTNETAYLTFVDGATGTQGIETDSGLTYNPSTGKLTTDALSSDTISEKTADSGVTIDSVKLKDGSVQLGTSGDNTISNSAGNTAITLPNASTDVQLAGGLKLDGNIIKSSTGDTVMTLSGSNVTISGNLSVDGSTDTVSSTNKTMTDVLIKLGNGATEAPSKDIGLVFTRGDGSSTNIANKAMIWDESEDVFAFIGADNEDASTTGNVTINSYADIQSKSIKLGDGTNTTTLNAASSGGALSLTLPSGNGTNGQYLETDGSGNLSWSTVSSGINDYITEGNTKVETVDNGSNGHIKFETEGVERMRIINDGKVGLGTSTPTSELEVAGTVKATAFNGNLTGNVIGNVTGGVTGNVVGNLTGNVTGNVVGDLTGDVTGNLVGNVTGNVSGSSGSCTGNAATATEATNVTVSANNSTNETTYLTFVDGATGTQGIETDTGLTYNPSTGTIVSEIVSTDTINEKTSENGVKIDGVLLKDNSVRVGSGTNNTTLSSSNSGGALNIVLPSGSGSNGQYLKTDGSGNLSWGTVSAGSADSITEGNTTVEAIDSGSDGHIKFSTEGSERMRVIADGKIGISTVTPSTELEINGTTTSKRFRQKFIVTVVSGKYLIDGVQNPILTLQRGYEYVFDVSDSSTANHPFYITTSSTGGGDAVTNKYENQNNTQVVFGNGNKSNTTDKTVIVKVPNNAPGSLYYQCSSFWNG